MAVGETAAAFGQPTTGTNRNPDRVDTAVLSPAANSTYRAPTDAASSPAPHGRNRPTPSSPATPARPNRRCPDDAAGLSTRNSPPATRPDRRDCSGSPDRRRSPCGRPSSARRWRFKPARPAPTTTASACCCVTGNSFVAACGSSGRWLGESSVTLPAGTGSRHAARDLSRVRKHRNRRRTAERTTDPAVPFAGLLLIRYSVMRWTADLDPGRPGITTSSSSGATPARIVRNQYMFKRVRKRPAGVVAAVAVTSRAVVAHAPGGLRFGTTEYVYSAAMGRNVPVRIISGGSGAANHALPARRPARPPTTTAAGSSTPTSTAGMVGRGSTPPSCSVAELFYTDWQTTTPSSARTNWETFPHP